eukprot:PITA_32792
MEGLSRIIKSVKEKNLIQGLQPMPSCPTTTHQQFVGDTMLHGTPTIWEAQGFKAILNLFSKASGIPLTEKPWQKIHWENLLSNLENRSKHWTNGALNFVGRLVLTKVVLQAIPQYMLSILPPPKGVLQKIRHIQKTFLWSGNYDKQKWTLVAWEKICKPRILGGLGLQDLDTINKAYGAKLWWR